MDIAAAFLIPPATMGQRLVRAKMRIKEGGIPFRIPDREELPERLDAVLEAIYGAFDLELSDDARSRMDDFLERRRSGQHGVHTYSLERYGLDRDALLERFRPYIEYFDVAITP